MKNRIIICGLILSLALPARAADIPVPVATDSRIKTFVYSENDVFNLVTHYGYQSNIEFGLQEEIETISVGDRVGWQISPSGRRLFVRAMTTSAHTNMTVITNKHAYQFDLIAQPAPVGPNEELAYVVRFFYPDDKKNTMASSSFDAQRSTPTAASAPAPSTTSATTPMYNYSYTFTGSEALAPLKLFDDGAATYFKFRSPEVSPSISLVSLGKEYPLTPRRSGEYWVVTTVGPQFAVRQGNAVVNVYNEKMSHQ